MSRTGKIARLPHEVREELNRRLLDGVAGPALLEWLNSLPAAQAVVKARFQGKPIRKQNLSDWRLGGYREWLKTDLAMAEIRRLVEQGQALKESGKSTLSDYLGTYVAVQYVAAAAEHDRKSADEMKWKQLRELCRDVTKMRSADHRAAELRLDQEWQKFKQNKMAG